MPLEFTMLFNFQGQGFSESWYHSGGGSLSSVDLVPIRSLLDARNNLTAKNVRLVGWRLSDVDNPGLTRAETTYFVNGGGDPDTATNAWLAMVRGADGKGRRQWWIRGVADNAIVWDPGTLSFKPTGAFKNKYDTFVGRVTVDPWRLRIVKSLKTSTHKGVVTGVTINGTGSVRLAGVPTTFSTVLTTEPVVITGFKGKLATLNGVYPPDRGAVIAASSIDLLNKAVPADAASAYTGGAWARSAEYDYVKPAQASLIAPRERRVGRAFFVPAGRRSRK